MWLPLLQQYLSDCRGLELSPQYLGVVPGVAEIDYAISSAAPTCKERQRKGRTATEVLLRQGISYALLLNCLDNATCSVLSSFYKYEKTQRTKRGDIPQWIFPMPILAPRSSVCQTDEHECSEGDYNNTTDIKATIHKKRKWSQNKNQNGQFLPSETVPRLLHPLNTPLNMRAKGCLPEPGMVNSCVDSMRIMTAEAETVALLIALMCSNTKFKKVSKK